MFFSIVIPVYNAQEYIEKAITSIQCQSFQDYEVICIDDGSTDNSAKILDGFSKKDQRIRIVHCENGGVSRARNTGIDLARGEYLLFMDSDDEYEQNALRILAEKLMSEKPDFLCFGYREVVYKDKQVIKNISKSYGNTEYNQNQIRREGLALISHPLFGSVWSKAYKRSLLQEKNIRMNENLYIGEDYCFNLDVIQYVHDFQTIEDALYIYKIQNNNSIINRYKKDKFSQMYRMHQIRTEFIQNCLDEKEEKKSAYIRYNYIRTCMSCFMDYSRKECTLSRKEQLKEISEKFLVEKGKFHREYMKYYSVPQKIVYCLFSTKSSLLIRWFAKGCYTLKFKFGKEV